jgi:hypothetical protein
MSIHIFLTKFEVRISHFLRAGRLKTIQAYCQQISFSSAYSTNMENQTTLANASNTKYRK